MPFSCCLSVPCCLPSFPVRVRVKVGVMAGARVRARGECF